MTSVDLRTYPDLVAALLEPASVKVLGVVNGDGAPHLAVKNSIRLEHDGNLAFDELIETSRSNAGLVRAMWFNRKVAINVVSPSGQAWLLSGRPIRTVISGGEFRRRYEAVRSQDPHGGLAAIWHIKIDDLSETTLAKRRLDEETAHPLLIHLDRLLAEPIEAGAEAPISSGLPEPAEHRELANSHVPKGHHGHNGLNGNNGD
ncbi:MAG: hypothetical protein LBT47_01765 [Deltaproteobacteria bacterium]|jgi:hypothetical protein|nr:hypothetical protein [Deltaproteobacteria bacterium]